MVVRSTFAAILIVSTLVGCGSNDGADQKYKQLQSRFVPANSVAPSATQTFMNMDLLRLSALGDEIKATTVVVETGKLNETDLVAQVLDSNVESIDLEPRRIEAGGLVFEFEPVSNVDRSQVQAFKLKGNIPANYIPQNKNHEIVTLNVQFKIQGKRGVNIDYLNSIEKRREIRLVVVRGNGAQRAQ